MLALNLFKKKVFSSRIIRFILSRQVKPVFHSKKELNAAILLRHAIPEW
jgi:hypothetical protein